ncbi:MAG: DUF975 family protein [Bacillota bacterium]|nr:DUF975 family protein [Bacillota bacterium]
MWRRSELKSNAKQNLMRKYWNAFAVSLVVGLLSSGSNIFSYSFSFNDYGMNNNQGNRFFDDFSGHFERFFNGELSLPFNPEWFGGIRTGFWLFAVLIGLVIGLAGVAYQIFVSPVIHVGGNRWYSRSRESTATPTIGMIFSLFKKGKYLQTVGSMLWMNLFLFLWGLIAAIPLLGGVTWVILQYIGSTFGWEGFGMPTWLYSWFGSSEAAMFAVFMLIMLASSLMTLPVIIKSYSYRMTPWVLADNPQIGYKRALKLSMQLTKGHKWRIFVLDLSFIGWFLLGLLACGIGVIFVAPYFQAVQAELYARLRRLGVDQNLCTMEELGFTLVNPVNPVTPVATEQIHEPDL